MKFIFSGVWVDGDQSSSSQTPEVDPYDNRNYTPTSLNTSAAYPTSNLLNGPDCSEALIEWMGCYCFFCSSFVEIENIWTRLMGISGTVLLAPWVLNKVCNLLVS